MDFISFFVRPTFGGDRQTDRHVTSAGCAATALSNLSDSKQKMILLFIFCVQNNMFRDILLNLKIGRARCSSFCNNHFSPKMITFLVSRYEREVSVNNILKVCTS